MKLTNCSHVISTIIGGSLLVGCGGGGESNPSQSTVTPAVVEAPQVQAPQVQATLSLSTFVATTISENQSQTLSLSTSYTGNKPLSVVITGTTNEVNISSTKSDSGFVFEISVSELMGKLEEELEITVTVTDGDISESTDLVLMTVNESLLNKYIQIEQITDNLDAYSASVELTNVVTYLVDKAYLYGEVSYEEGLLLNGNLTELVQTTSDNTIDTSAQIYASILTQQNDVTETEVLTLITQAEEVIFNSGGVYPALLIELNKLLIPTIPIFSEFHLSQFEGEFSLFYGNQNYGEVVNEVWQFKADWTFLEQLLSTTTSSCLVAQISQGV
jgi:hypothetical protein